MEQGESALAWNRLSCVFHYVLTCEAYALLREANVLMRRLEQQAYKTILP